VLVVAAGGALGTLFRYWLNLAFAPATPPAFPWVTLAVNVSGAFLLGLMVTLVVEVWPPTRYVRPFAAIGMLGGFTTFSTLVVETDRLLGSHLAVTAMLYVVGSLVLGVVAVWAGSILARTRTGSRH
jgi:CrcB protein